MFQFIMYMYFVVTDIAALSYFIFVCFLGYERQASESVTREAQINILN